MGQPAKPTKKRISSAQLNLLEAMRNGVAVHFNNLCSAYYFRSDTFRACSPTAFALLDLGLVCRVEEKHSGHMLKIINTATVDALITSAKN